MELKEAQHVREAQLKAREEKLYNQGAVGKESTPTQAGCDRVMAERPSLLFELLHKAERSSIEAARNKRAVEILQKHPEFEELLELLRLVPLNALY
jgi:hypothetical protein